LDEIISGNKVSLRLVTLEDCTQEYVSWLEDPEVNKYLETRWSKQTLETIKDFVSGIRNSSDSYLFAIIENQSRKHIGNIKIGPVNKNHSYADTSYFIGDKSSWGKGYATEAIRLVTGFGFEKLGLHRLQAGLYESNIGSERCLIKAGYSFEGCMKKQLKSDKGWEGHKFYGILREEWAKKENKN